MCRELIISFNIQKTFRGERIFKMNFENGMTCEIMISNGTFTVVMSMANQLNGLETMNH
jgi:hypothetical protein